MKIVITGATGNVGTSLIEALARDEQVDELVGIARRLPEATVRGCSFERADIVEDDLCPIFRGADVVVHLAWQIQPMRDLAELERVNCEGSRRVFRAALDAGVPSLVYASSVGTYAPASKATRRDEGWSTEGISTSVYSRQKARVERLLDQLESERSDTRVVRMRPGLIFKRGAASEIKRYFIGRLVPARLIGPKKVPVVPAVPDLRFQAVHAHDVADAFRRAILSDARGAFNLAADPVLEPEVIAQVLGARVVPMKARTLRRLTALSYRLRLQPTEPGWLDLALQVPIMDVGRAQRELGWAPYRSSTQALRELFEGIEARDGMATEPLAPLA